MPTYLIYLYNILYFRKCKWKKEKTVTEKAQKPVKLDRQLSLNLVFLLVFPCFNLFDFEIFLHKYKTIFRTDLRKNVNIRSVIYDYEFI